MSMSRVILMLAAALTSATWPVRPAEAAPPVSLRQVASGLSLPTNLVNARDGSGRLFIVEQSGRIKILAGGTVLATSFLNLAPANVLVSGGEQGLLGLAFHPQYASNGAFYVFYTATGGGALTVARYLRDPANANQALPNSGAVILSVPHPVNTNHNGGHLAFGPDGFLYISTGDGGGGGDPDRTGLDLKSRRGKLLRIAVDGGTSYTIPPGNPYEGSTCATACPEIWAYGLRNPWKYSFDRMTGDLFIGDVGQGAVEEVNFQAAGSPGGQSYGWGAYEGNNCYNDSYFGVAGACAAQAGHTRPILTYLHSAGGIAVTGGYRYRGANSPALQGYYLYADYANRQVFAARPGASDTWTPEVLLPSPAAISSISSFGEDEAGELYIVDYGNGKIWAIDGPTLALTSVVSRKTHGAAGEFPLTVNHVQPINGTITTEPRTLGTGHRLTFNFNGPINLVGGISCTDAAGTPVGLATYNINGNQVDVTVTAMPDRRRARITLQNINALGFDVSASVAFLTGDINSTQSVTASDIVTIKARNNLPVNAGNYLADVDLSGSIDATDRTLAKSLAGSRIP